MTGPLCMLKGQALFQYKFAYFGTVRIRKELNSSFTLFPREKN